MFQRAVCCLAVILPSLAYAQEPTSTAPTGDEPARRVSLTWSPLHLALPLVELTGEVRLRDHVGVAVIGGVGSVTDRATQVRGRAIEAGGQLHWYPLRPFAGLDVGVEALYLHLDDVNLDAAATAAGLAIGPFVGYKAMFPFGLTLVAQVGFEVVAVRAETRNGMSNDRGIIPLLNLNAGWSF